MLSNVVFVATGCLFFLLLPQQRFKLFNVYFVVVFSLVLALFVVPLYFNVPILSWNCFRIISLIFLGQIAVAIILVSIGFAYLFACHYCMRICICVVQAFNLLLSVLVKLKT